MAWLMPANMIINTASVVGYNNKLKQAVSGTKLGGRQRAKHRHKKIGAEADGRGPLKNKTFKQPPFTPGPQSFNGRSRPASIQKTPKRVRFNLPSDEVGQIKETFKETEKTDHHETNKTAVIVGVVAVAALLVLASR